jgi:hypothetical protein
VLVVRRRGTEAKGQQILALEVKECLRSTSRSGHVFERAPMRLYFAHTKGRKKMAQISTKAGKVKTHRSTFPMFEKAEKALLNVLLIPES